MQFFKVNSGGSNTVAAMQYNGGNSYQIQEELRQPKVITGRGYDFEVDTTSGRTTCKLEDWVVVFWKNGMVTDKKEIVLVEDAAFKLFAEGA